MSIVNFSKSTTNDILKQVKQAEAAQTRKKNKANHINNQLTSLENAGILDAINYAPKREWKHLFTHTPISDYIDGDFIKKLGREDINNSFSELKDVQNRKQIANKFRNVAGTLALGAGIVAATLTPLGHLTGLGYLAGFTNAAMTSCGVLGAMGSTAQLVNTLHLNPEEDGAFGKLKTSLTSYARDNVTDMHKYWNAVDKLSKLSLTEEQALNMLSGAYTEANNKLRSEHNTSLVDVYLDNDDKSNLKNYRQVDNSSFVAKQFSKNMTSLPITDSQIYLDKGIELTGITTNNNDINEVNRIVGFKIKILDDIGVKVNKANLGLEGKTYNADEDINKANDFNNAINKAYGSALDDALLIYQGKHSMAAPIIEKVEKVLQNALEIFSREAIKQAKARNLKKVPEITEQLVEKVLSAIMLQTSIPANDTKLTKILNAIASNTALKVSANLNNYATDTGQAEKKKALYGAASLDNLYDDPMLKKLRGKLSKIDNDEMKTALAFLGYEAKKQTEAKKIFKDIVAREGKVKGKPILGFNRDEKVVVRRVKWLPHFIPFVTGASYNHDDQVKFIKNNKDKI